MKDSTNKNWKIDPKYQEMAVLYRKFLEGELDGVRKLVRLIKDNPDQKELLEYESMLSEAVAGDGCLPDEELALLEPADQDQHTRDHLTKCKRCRLVWLDMLVEGEMAPGIEAYREAERTTEQAVEREHAATQSATARTPEHGGILKKLWSYLVWPYPVAPAAAALAIAAVVLFPRGQAFQPRPVNDKFVSSLLGALPDNQGMGFTGEKDRRPKGFVLGIAAGLGADLKRAGKYRKYSLGVLRKFRLNKDLQTLLSPMVQAAMQGRDPCAGLDRKLRDDCRLGLNTYVFLRDRKGPFADLWRGLAVLAKRVGIAMPKALPARPPVPGRDTDPYYRQIRGLTLKVLTF